MFLRLERVRCADGQPIVLLVSYRRPPAQHQGKRPILIIRRALFARDESPVAYVEGFYPLATTRAASSTIGFT